MEVVIKSDHQFDKCGNEYLRNQNTNLTISDDCNDEFLSLRIEGIDGEFYIERQEILRALKILTEEGK